MAETDVEIPQEDAAADTGYATQEQFAADVAAEEAKGKSSTDTAPPPPEEKPTTEKPAEVEKPNTSPQRTWEDDIKGLSLQQILAAKNADPKLIGLVSTYETQGDITQWLAAATTNYDAMDDAAILRQDVIRRYPTITDPQEQEELYQDELAKYKLEATDPEDEFEKKEVRLSKIKLKAAVHETRNQLKKEQSDRLIPSFDPNAGKAEQAAVAAQQLQQKQQYVEQHPAVKTLLDKKTIPFGEGDDAFHFPIAEPQQVVEWAKTVQSEPDGMLDANGKPDIEKQMRTGIVAMNYEAIIKAAIAHGKVLGAKGLATELTNPGEVKATTASDGEKDPYEAMAKRGKVRSA